MKKFERMINQKAFVEILDKNICEKLKVKLPESKLDSEKIKVFENRGNKDKSLEEDTKDEWMKKSEENKESRDEMKERWVK